MTSNSRFHAMMQASTHLCFLALVFSAVGFCGGSESTAADATTNDENSKSPVAFKTHQIGTFRSEACGTGDFNNDGRLDIVAGEYLYLAPDWMPRKIRSIEGDIDDQGKGYNRDFMNAPLDIDGDGWLDIVSCSWHGKQIEWYRNPGPIAEGQAAPTDWKVTVVFQNGNYECGELVDIDGDGQKLEVLPAVQGTVWYEVGEQPSGKRGLIRHVVDEKHHIWGSGVGDINGDGRPDILRPSAWYEAPSDIRHGKWKEHPIAVGSEKDGQADHTPQILVYDVNADGLSDIVTSVAHKYGIFWYEQIPGSPEPEWKRHVIDNTWSQAHNLELADLDADGDLDLVTGKRFMAHNGHDPGAAEPPGVYWYELDRGTSPTWTKHVISYDEQIGSGMNIPVVDLDGDGDLDVIVTGKWGGPVWFENLNK